MANDHGSISQHSVREPVRDVPKIFTRIESRATAPNVPDQRPPATDARIGTETQSRGSLLSFFVRQSKVHHSKISGPTLRENAVTTGRVTALGI